MKRENCDVSSDPICPDVGTPDRDIPGVPWLGNFQVGAAQLLNLTLTPPIYWRLDKRTTSPTMIDDIDSEFLALLGDNHSKHRKSKSGATASTGNGGTSSKSSKPKRKRPAEYVLLSLLFFTRTPHSSRPSPTESRLPIWTCLLTRN